MSAIKDRNTIAPASGTTNQISDLYEMLAELRPGNETLFLSVAGCTDLNRNVTVPVEVADMFARIITSLHAGQPISVIPHDLMVTTQEAAELLGLSRPTVIKLIDAGALSCEMVGSHRRIPFGAVQEYRNRRREQVQDMLEATRLDDDISDPAELREALRAARSEVATRRRKV